MFVVIKFSKQREKTKQMSLDSHCDKNTHRGGFLPHLKGPGSAKAERGNDGIFSQRWFIVTVPVYAVLLVSVQVAEQGVEGIARELFNALL